MTPTPPLGRRIVLVSITVVVLVLALVDVFLYAALKVNLNRALDEVLDERAAVATFEASRTSVDQLARQLQQRGLRAVVRTPDGTEFHADPVSPQLGNNLPPAGDDTATVSRIVVLPAGGQVEVFARTSGTTSTLQLLLALELAGSIVAIAAAAALLHHTSRIALRPLRQITAAAHRTTDGHQGERLRPDNPGTELGEMAAAYDGMLDQLEDALTDAREARNTSALLAAVVDGTADAVIAEDLDGTVLSWNPCAASLYGYEAQDAIGRPAGMLIPGDRTDETHALLRQVRGGHVVSAYETQRVTHQEVLVDVSVTLSPVHDPNGELIAISSIARDLTVQRRMATELKDVMAALRVAVEETRRSEESTRRFLADAAHQLRTPVAGIRACAETLLRGPSTEDRDRLLATMVRETSRAGRLVGSLLQMARLDQGDPLAVSAVDLVSLCGYEVDRVDLLAPDLDVRLLASPATCGLWQLDPSATREIVSNLLDNARRHAHHRIDVLLEQRDGELAVRVFDDGPGVPGEDRGRVFERFVSLDGRGGSGLGLPIARGLARAMGGRLTYDDGFVLTLPATTSAVHPPISA